MVVMMASMAHIAIHHVQQIVNQVHVMMSLVTVWRDVSVASMVYSAKILVLQTVKPLIATEIQAIVTLDALLVSLAICATNNVLLTVLVVVTKSAVLVQSAKKVSLLENVVNLALQIVKVFAIKFMETVPMAAKSVSMGISVTDLARVIVIQPNVFKALDIVWVNVKLDSMVTIATTLVQ